MRSSRWLAGLAAVFLSVPALAEGVFIQPRRTVPADRPSRVYVFFNCTTNIIAGVDGRAEHGRITTRMGTQRRCGRTGQDVLEVYYAPESGYRGPDDLHIYSGGGHWVLHVKVADARIAAKASGGSRR